MLTLSNTSSKNLNISWLFDDLEILIFILTLFRAKKEDFKFLVAVYACDEDFYLENPQMNRLYCSQGSWVGNYPVCVSKGDNDRKQISNSNQSKPFQMF